VHTAVPPHCLNQCIWARRPLNVAPSPLSGLLSFRGISLFNIDRQQQRSVDDPNTLELRVPSPATPPALQDNMTDYAAPVKAILKALETGIKLTKKVSESAELAVSEFASPATEAKAYQISQSAPGLQRSLEQTAQAIRDAYQQEVETCGKTFAKALVEDSERFCSC
jgi:hypothetical protein